MFSISFPRLTKPREIKILDKNTNKAKAMIVLASIKVENAISPRLWAVCQGKEY